MSNDVNNLAHSFVAMAQAFEQLPIVKEELLAATHRNAEYATVVERLELRIIDLKNELDAAHAATRKVEVERDHAEHMFLETDDRLNAFRRLVQAFDTDVKSLVQAAEPEPKPEPEVKAIDNPLYADPQPEPGPAVGDAFTLGQGERAVDPIPTAVSDTDTISESPAVGVSSHTTAASPIEAVSVQPDPTQATESSSENGLSGLGSQGLREADPTVSTDSTYASPNVSTQPAERQTTASYATEEAPHPVDPTASSTAGDGHSQASATPTTDAIDSAGANTQAPTPTVPSEPGDDVGYHNEPKIIGTGAEAWAEWDKWCERMDARYPHSAGGWPPRSLAAQ